MIIVWIVVALALLYFAGDNLNVFAIGDPYSADVEIVGTWSRGLNSFDLLKPFAVATDKSAYYAGETIKITVQDILDDYCNIGITSQVDFLDSSGNLLGTKSESLGTGGYMTIFTQAQITTNSNTPQGTYSVRNSVFCNGQLVGDDGIRGHTYTNSKHSVSITILGQDDDEPEPSCNLQCGLGEKLIDNYPNCYCEAQWTANNGVCELGEPPSVSDDCDADECDAGEVLYKGACFPANLVCEEHGGTANCDRPPGFDFDPLLIVALGLIIFGVILNKKKR